MEDCRVADFYCLFLYTLSCFMFLICFCFSIDFDYYLEYLIESQGKQEQHKLYCMEIPLRQSGETCWNKGCLECIMTSILIGLATWREALQQQCITCEERPQKSLVQRPLQYVQVILLTCLNTELFCATVCGTTLRKIKECMYC